eukprot:2032856-Pyramimonas_sp.AAC.1
MRTLIATRIDKPTDHIPEELDQHLLAVAQVLGSIETKQKSVDAAAKAAKASGDEEADPCPKVGEKAEDDDDLAVALPVPGDDEAMEDARKRVADALQSSQEDLAKAKLDSEEVSKKLKLSATAATSSAGQRSGDRPPCG